MKPPVIVIGLGEIGAVFARGFLRLGHPVYPVIRDMQLEKVWASYPDPELVILAVGEADLQQTLTELPEAWRSKTVLLQNELLPGDWQQQHIQNPTVISIWFEKKQGQDSKVIMPSPAYGPHAELLEKALGSIDIPVKRLQNEDQLLHELVLKNVYILTTNIAGLKTGGSVGELWSQHQALARDIATDVISIQEKLTGQSLDNAALIDGMVSAFNADPAHKCMGRSAPARLQRALQIADSFKLEVPHLRAIQSAI